eukprot:3463696-Pleurochrysis_carterae.AAC.1
MRLRALVRRCCAPLASAAATRLSIAYARAATALLAHAPLQQCPDKAARLMRQMPVHYAAAKPFEDQRGLRLNVLRICIEVRCTPD